MVIPAKSTDVLKIGTSIMVSSTAKSKLTDLIEITPAVLSFDHSTAIVDIEVSNHGNRPVLIQPSAVIAELQQVSFVDDLDNSSLNGKQVVEKETFLQQFNLSDTDLTLEQRERANNLLWNFEDIFSENEFDLGHTGLIKHEIHLTDDAPFKDQHRRIPPSLYAEVKEHLSHLKRCNIIQESASPWASPVVVVRKKSGALHVRLCVDYRQVNKCTVKDSYALPRIDELIDHFEGSK